MAVSLRLVACGASNLARGLARLLAAVSGDPPVVAFVAAGHGRSYGSASRIWMRRLPSITGCGLWRALDREADEAAVMPTVAVLTDIGNDLLYGFSVEQTAEWVDTCLGRLEARGARCVLTRLPLESVAGVGRLRYRALRTCYVPGCTLSLPELVARAEALDGRLTELASAHKAAVVEQPGNWYGLDAIHPRRRRLDDLWAAVCRAWGQEPLAASAGWATWARVGLAAAEVRMLAGSLRLAPQPAVRLPCGGSVSFY